MLVLRRTAEVNVIVTLFNEGVTSHEGDKQIVINHGKPGGLSFKYRLQDSQCVVNGNALPCDRNTPPTYSGTKVLKADISLYFEKRAVTP